MEWIEEEGKTRSEALEKALSKIGLPEEKVEVEVIQENKKKFGIIGTRQVKIKVSYDPRDRVVVIAKENLEEILHKMDLTCVVEEAERNGSLCLNIISPQSALIIGKRGETIDALQYLMSRIVSKKMSQKVNVIVDTENYREKHVDKIEKLARKTADEVRSTGRAAFLAPMNSRDRRIVHLTLQDDRNVSTLSKGEGPRRKIKISPRAGGEVEE